VAVGIAGGLATVAVLTGAQGNSYLINSLTQAGRSIAPKRPLGAMKYDAALETAESLSPQSLAQVDASSGSSASSHEALVDTRLTGLQMREQFAALSFDSP
jgi:hypothetical protein